MDVSGQLHTTSLLLPANEPPLFIGPRSECETFRETKAIGHARNQTRFLGQAALNPVPVPTAVTGKIFPLSVMLGSS